MTTNWEGCPHCKLVFIDTRMDYDNLFWHPAFRGPDKEKQYHDWHVAKEEKEKSDELRWHVSAPGHALDEALLRVTMNGGALSREMADGALRR